MHRPRRAWRQGLTVSWIGRFSVCATLTYSLSDRARFTELEEHARFLVEHYPKIARVHVDQNRHMGTYHADKGSVLRLRKELRKCGPGFDKVLPCLSKFLEDEFSVFERNVHADAKALSEHKPDAPPYWFGDPVMRVRADMDLAAWHADAQLFPLLSAGALKAFRDESASAMDYVGYKNRGPRLGWSGGPPPVPEASSFTAIYGMPDRRAIALGYTREHDFRLDDFDPHWARTRPEEVQHLIRALRAQDERRRLDGGQYKVPPLILHPWAHVWASRSEYNAALGWVESTDSYAEPQRLSPPRPYFDNLTEGFICQRCKGYHLEEYRDVCSPDYQRAQPTQTQSGSTELGPESSDAATAEVGQAAAEPASKRRRR